MLIIVEGTDGTGKTTLIEELRELLAELPTGGLVEVLHRGPPEDHPLVEYEDALHGYAPGSGVHMLCDRWHLGELVYAPLYRDGSELGGRHGAGRRHVELFLQSRGALLVHLTADEDEVHRRLDARGEDYLKREHVGHTLRAFDDAAATALTWRVNLRSPYHPAAVPSVATAGHEAELQAAALAPFWGYVGHPRPDVLLVGDRANASGRQLPFLPLGNACSGWLLDSLDPWTLRVGLVNAHEEDVEQLWVALRQPQVVALGREAQTVLGRSLVPHGAVPHPQYARRFHHRRQRTYAAAIMHAAQTGEDVIASWQT